MSDEAPKRNVPPASGPTVTSHPELSAEPEEPRRPSLLPGSGGEHKLQEKYGSKARAINFYEKQMLSYLAPAMKDFIARQEFLFVATADRHGECDCTSFLRHWRLAQTNEALQPHGS